MLSLVHGSWYFMPVIDLCVLFVLSLYIGYGGMQCYLHTSPLLCTTVISQSLYLFSVKLIFELLLMLDLFLSYPCVLSLIYCLWCNTWCNTCMPYYVHTSLLLRAIASLHLLNSQASTDLPLNLAAHKAGMKTGILG